MIAAVPNTEIELSAVRAPLRSWRAHDGMAAPGPACYRPSHAPGLVVAAMLKALIRHPRVQAGLAALLGGYLRFALSTTRWRVEGQTHLDATVARRPVITAFWHERLPMIPAMWLRVWCASGRKARAFVLVSRHRDGRFIGEIIRCFHLLPVHGSSARDGRERGGAAAVSYTHLTLPTKA